MCATRAFVRRLECPLTLEATFMDGTTDDVRTKTSGGGGPADPTTATLLKALEAARSQATDIEARIGELDTKLRVAQEEVGLIERLLALRGALPVVPGVGPQGEPGALSAGQRGHEVVDAVVEILGGVEHPLPISEIMRLLRESIPGAGTQANLISHLTRDSRVIRPSRGVYALARWGTPQLTYSASKKRARKSRRRRRTRGAKP
jgi:hypothetical protein